MENRIMFSPEPLEKKSHSVSSFRSRVLSKQRSSRYLKNEIFTSIRKNLPQTSNLLIKSSGSPPKSKLHIITSQEHSSSRLDYTPESMILLRKIKDRLSQDLFDLIVKIWNKHGSCPIFPDNSISEYNSYEHLFSPDYQKIDSPEEIKTKPDFLIISSRSSIYETNFAERPSLNEARSVNYINLYSSIISKDSKSLQNYRNFQKSPIFKVKNQEFRQRFCKSPVPDRENFGIQVKREERIHIFPYSKGGRVKEGAGGFKKPFLLFEKKRKHSQSPVNDQSDRSHRVLAKNSRLVQRENSEIDEICINFSITHHEYFNVLSEFLYLKENCLNYGESIAQAYQVRPEVLKGINPEISKNDEVEWEDYLKFHVIVILRRGNFRDLLCFVVNLIENNNSKMEEVLWVSKVFGKNYNLVEKVIKIQAGVKGLDKKAKMDPAGHLQDIGLNILDLRLMVTLIVRNFY
jgi:hypothetical protein